MGMQNRLLSRTDLTLMVVNTVVGAGIIALPGRAYALSGEYAFYALAVAVTAGMSIALTFARLAIRFQGPGGPYLYVTRTLGPSAGLATLTLLVPTRLLATAVSLNILVEALGVDGFGWPRIGVIGVVSVAMTALALTGVYLPIQVSNLLGALKVSLLGGLAAAGTVALIVGVPTQTQPIGTESLHIGSAVLIWFYALSGFESSTILAAESRNSARDLPVALITGLTIASVLYAALLMTCIAFSPNLSTSNDPLLRLDGPLSSQLTPFLMLAFASLVVATLPSQFTVAPRLLASIGTVHGRTLFLPDSNGASVRAILVCSTLVILLSVLDVTTLIISSGLVRLASYAACSIGLLRAAQVTEARAIDSAIGISALIACLVVVGLAAA